MRYIAIPIYDHTRDEELDEIMEELDRLGFSQQPFVIQTSEDLHNYIEE